MRLTRETAEALHEILREALRERGGQGAHGEYGYAVLAVAAEYGRHAVELKNRLERSKQEPQHLVVGQDSSASCGHHATCLEPA